MEAFLDRLAPIWIPHPGQREFLLNEAKFKVLSCGRRWGKTDACAAQILAALHQPSPTRHLILAPTLDQAKLLFARVESLLDALFELEGRDRAEIAIRRSPFPLLKFNGHRVIARSGHLGRSLRGNEATHVVVDEAAFVPEELVTEVAMPMLATTDGVLTLISTPHGRNHFWRFFEMGQVGEHSVWSRTAPTSESPFVRPDFLVSQRDLISERAFAVEYEAQFFDDVGRVFKAEALDSCLVPRFLDNPQPPFGIGVDWGRYQDFTAVVVVAGKRQGARIVHVERFNQMPWGHMVERVAAVVRQFPSAIVHLDGTAVGDPLHENLRPLVPSAMLERIVFTSVIKSSLITNLAWMVENGTLQMTPHPELVRELRHFETRTSGSGSQKFSAPSGYHDDLVVALALAVNAIHAEYKAGTLLGNERRFSCSRLLRKRQPAGGRVDG